MGWDQKILLQMYGCHWDGASIANNLTICAYMAEAITYVIFISLGVGEIVLFLPNLKSIARTYESCNSVYFFRQNARE